jgi:glucose/arabinose dehydrogenase
VTPVPSPAVNRFLPTVLVLALLAAACGDDDSGGTTAGPTTTIDFEIGPGPTQAVPTTTPPTTEPPAPLQGLDVETVARTLSNPVLAVAPPGDDRLFVVEKEGMIRIIDPTDGLLDAPFLDLVDQVESDGLEQGMVGLAFHPRYPDNGRFFVYFTAEGSGDTRLIEYAVSDDPDRADRESATVILRHEQPAANHNAGMLEFGPDGYLWVALGDGGGANDQFGNAQDPGTILGSLLRLDVDAASPYAIPPDNPFVDGGGDPRVWAYGLRNPYRFSIDPGARLVYVGDVGQDEWEEVSVAPFDDAGLNYGWPILEGLECNADPCDPSGTVTPVVAYDHGEGCSVIGGYVYRGAAIPELAGHYFYGDWCGRWVRSFFYDGVASDQQDWTTDFGELGGVLGFGRDDEGELYVLTQDGFVLKIVPVR